MATKLKETHEKYALNLFAGMSQREAYLAAGYSPNQSPATLDKHACALAKNEKIKSRLSELQKAAESDAILTKQEGLKIMTAVARSLEDKLWLEAIKEIAKQSGWYPSEKLDITSKGNEIKTAPIIQVVNIETMNALTRIENGGRATAPEIDNNIPAECRSLSQPADPAGS